MFSLHACNFTSTHTEPSYEFSANGQLSLSKTPASASISIKSTPAETQVKKEDCGKKQCKTSACHKDWTPEVDAKVIKAHQEAAKKK